MWFYGAFKAPNITYLVEAERQACYKSRPDSGLADGRPPRAHGSAPDPDRSADQIRRGFIDNSRAQRIIALFPAGPSYEATRRLSPFFPAR